jgi:hypothetical protein
VTPGGKVLVDQPSNSDSPQATTTSGS